MTSVATDEAPVYPEICANCECYLDRTTEDMKERVGTCHRYPPLPTGHGRSAIFPLVLPTWHCYEFRFLKDLEDKIG